MADKNPKRRIEENKKTGPVEKPKGDLMRRHSLEKVNQQVEIEKELNEFVKTIRPLTQEERDLRKTRFESRYSVHPYSEQTGLRVMETGLKGKTEKFYQTGLDFKNGHIISINNNHTFDKASGEGAMHLSDIHGQLVRKGLEERGDPVDAFKPQTIVDESAYEPNTLKVTDEILPIQTRKDLKGSRIFPKGTCEYSQIMLTKLGKQKLYLVGEYFPNYEISSITVERGNKPSYLKKMTYHLKEK